MMIPFKGISESFPIKVVKGLMVTEARIEGQDALVILDTGAPGLVLNQKYFSADAGEGIVCTGINGTFECHTHLVKEWTWLGTTHKKTQALVSDLSFLERALNRDIHALIGLSVLTDYYVSIDFDLNTIRLNKKLDDIDQSLFSKFQYANHLPVLTCKVNGAKKILGLDTGAEGNYLFAFEDVSDPGMLASSSPILVIGTDNTEDIKHSLSMDLEVSNLENVYSSSFIVDLIDEGYFSDEAFDGILGQAFLSQFNIIIHPGKQRILFIEREQSEGSEQ
jgi:hypothetical protein